MRQRKYFCSCLYFSLLIFFLDRSTPQGFLLFDCVVLIELFCVFLFQLQDFFLSSINNFLLKKFFITERSFCTEKKIFLLFNTHSFIPSIKLSLPLFHSFFLFCSCFQLCTSSLFFFFFIDTQLFASNYALPRQRMRTPINTQNENMKNRESSYFLPVFSVHSKALVWEESNEFQQRYTKYGLEPVLGWHTECQRFATLQRLVGIFSDPSDAIALMSVVSSFYAAEDDLVANLRHYCLKSSLQLPTHHSSVPGSDHDMRVERDFLTSSLQQKYGAPHTPFTSSTSQSGGTHGPQDLQDLLTNLFELAAIVEQHIFSTTNLRANSRKMVQRMTVRHSTVGTHQGGARGSAVRSASMHTVNMLGDASPIPTGPSGSVSSVRGLAPGVSTLGGFNFGHDWLWCNGRNAYGDGLPWWRWCCYGRRQSIFASLTSLPNQPVGRGRSLTYTRLLELRSTASVSSFQRGDGSGELHRRANITHDSEGNKLINEYLVIGELGRGAYGKVKLVEHRQTGDLAAIKIINRSVTKKSRAAFQSTNLIHIQTEIAVMKKMRHRNIVSLYEVIDDPAKDKMYLVMQYVPDGPREAWTGGVCDPRPGTAKLRGSLHRV